MPSSTHRFFARATVVALGAASFAWAGLILIAWPQPPAIDRIADRIVRAEPYKVDELHRFVPVLEEAKRNGWSRAASLRAAAIIELRQAESAIADGRRTAIDDRMEALGRSLHLALSVAPSDPFLWLVLSWRGSIVEGFNASHLPLLAASYRLGPNEGWIAVRRSPRALALFSRLPEDLAQRVVAEFIGLVNSGFPEMAQILVGPGWTARDTLLPRLAAAREVSRKSFERAVYRLGYDVVVPGVARSDARPWRR